MKSPFRKQFWLGLGIFLILILSSAIIVQKIKAGPCGTYTCLGTNGASTCWNCQYDKNGFCGCTDLEYSWFTCNNTATSCDGTFQGVSQGSTNNNGCDDIGGVCSRHTGTIGCCSNSSNGGGSSSNPLLCNSYLTQKVACPKDNPKGLYYNYYTWGDSSGKGCVGPDYHYCTLRWTGIWNATNAFNWYDFTCPNPGLNHCRTPTDVAGWLYEGTDARYMCRGNTGGIWQGYMYFDVTGNYNFAISPQFSGWGEVKVYIDNRVPNTNPTPAPVINLQHSGSGWCYGQTSAQHRFNVQVTAGWHYFELDYTNDCYNGATGPTPQQIDVVFNSPDGSMYGGSLLYQMPNDQNTGYPGAGPLAPMLSCHPPWPTCSISVDKKCIITGSSVTATTNCTGASSVMANGSSTAAEGIGFISIYHANTTSDLTQGASWSPALASNSNSNSLSATTTLDTAGSYLFTSNAASKTGGKCTGNQASTVIWPNGLYGNCGSNDQVQVDVYDDVSTPSISNVTGNCGTFTINWSGDTSGASHLWIDGMDLGAISVSPYTTAYNAGYAVGSHSIFIRSTNACKGTHDSNTEYTTANNCTPVAPGNVSCSCSTGSMNVTWTDNSNNETGFHLYRSPGFFSTPSTGPDISSYTDTSAVQDTWYMYTVGAYNDSGEAIGNWCGPAMCCSQVGPPNPTATIWCTQTDQGVNVSWPAVAGAGSYDLLVDGSTVKSGVVTNYVNNLSLTCGSHLVQIKDYSTCSTPGTTNIGGTTVTVPCAPNPPGSATAVDDGNIPNNHILVSWVDGDAGLSGFNVYRSDISNPPAVKTTTGPAVFNWTDALAVCGTQYGYSVSALKSSNPVGCQESIRTPPGGVWAKCAAYSSYFEVQGGDVTAAGGPLTENISPAYLTFQPWVIMPGEVPLTPAGLVPLPGIAFGSTGVNVNRPDFINNMNWIFSGSNPWTLMNNKPENTYDSMKERAKSRSKSGGAYMLPGNTLATTADLQAAITAANSANHYMTFNYGAGKFNVYVIEINDPGGATIGDPGAPLDISSLTPSQNKAIILVDQGSVTIGGSITMTETNPATDGFLAIFSKGSITLGNGVAITPTPTGIPPQYDITQAAYPADISAILYTDGAFTVNTSVSQIKFDGAIAARQGINLNRTSKGPYPAEFVHYNPRLIRILRDIGLRRKIVYEPVY